LHSFDTVGETLLNCWQAGLQIQFHLKETVVDFANHEEMQSPFAHQTKVQARTWKINLFAHFLPPPPASVHNPALLMQLHPLD
jgi:hypothetical protein